LKCASDPDARSLPAIAGGSSPPSSEDDLLARVGDAQAVVSATIVPFTARVMERCPDPGLLPVSSTGDNDEDLAAARRSTVTSVPGYSAHSVAEHAWAVARRPIVVNAAGGEILEMAALWEAIDPGQVRGAGLDELRGESPERDRADVQRPLAAGHVTLSSHRAMHADAALRRLARMCIDDIEAVPGVQAPNVVSA